MRLESTWKSSNITQTITGRRERTYLLVQNLHDDDSILSICFEMMIKYDGALKYKRITFPKAWGESDL